MKRNLVIGSVAGFIGGLAEIVWIWLAYAGTPHAARIARGVAEAVSMGSSVSMGIIVHMVLAVALGIMLAVAFSRLLNASRFALVTASLIGVWAFNFFIFLPAFDPAFVALVPLPIAFISKLLFGLSAADTFRRIDLADFRMLVEHMR